MDILIGDHVYVMAVLSTLENKLEITNQVIVQVIMTKKLKVDNGANKNVLETISATVNHIKKENEIKNTEKTKMFC